MRSRSQRAGTPSAADIASTSPSSAANAPDRIIRSACRICSQYEAVDLSAKMRRAMAGISQGFGETEPKVSKLHWTRADRMGVQVIEPRPTANGVNSIRPSIPR